MYRIGNIVLLISIMLLASCDTEEEFPVNSSSFLINKDNNTTLIYEGKKAGDFAEAAENINWKGITKLIVKGHINNKDIARINRYVSSVFNGELKELDFRDAELFEGQFINQPFNSLKNLERFVYPRKMKATGDRVIDGNGSYWIKEVIIPEEVEILGERVFMSVSIKNTSMGPTLDLPYMPKEKYKIPAMVKELGYESFSRYPYESIDIPNSVQRLGGSVFSESKLTEITIPKSIIQIPDYCFSNSTALKRITLNNELTSIGHGAFMNTAIEELVLPDNISFIGHIFLGGVTTLNPDNIKWPKHLTELGERVMEGTKFEEFRIPQQFTNIGRSCFYTSDIKRLWFHSNITQLGHGFINGMDSLEEVHVMWTTPPIADKLFDNVVISPLGNVINKSPDFTKVKLYVPIGTTNAYRNAEGWKKVQQIIEE